MGKEVIVRADEVIEEDLYAFGDTVVIEGTVRGDVMASGREVRLLGTVEGDLTGCGQTYIVDGRVGDDLRIAGMTTVLGHGARIGGDFVTAGSRSRDQQRELGRWKPPVRRLRGDARRRCLRRLPCRGGRNRVGRKC